MKILAEATPLALWYHAVQEAEANCKIILHSELESYLVFTLIRYMTCGQLTQEAVAVSFLKGMQGSPHLRASTLQAIGDRCLIIAGLFPALAEKRPVKLSYYVKMGQLAYEIISRKKNDIFGSLAKQFVPLTAVLHSFRLHSVEDISR